MKETPADRVLGAREAPIAPEDSGTPLPPAEPPSSERQSGTVDLYPASGGQAGDGVTPPGGRPEAAAEEPSWIRTVDFEPVADPGATVDPSQGEWLVPVRPAEAAAPAARRPRVVAGYDILGVLGRGAMGVVYKARQRGLNRPVALKMILSGEEASEQELERFKVEAEAVARIQHANIVQIHEVGEHEGRPYFSLEFVGGGTLAARVKEKPLPPREAARIVEQLAAGMACAHGKGIIHRDLKPANVLLTEDGVPKITDFGLAKRLEDEAGRTTHGVILGTPSYMAPEQAEGRVTDVGPLADVYALGIVLYELLTGRVPFKAPTLVETLEQVRKREAVRPSELQPGVPRDLETICLKCIQKDPARRYADAAALGEDLRRFQANEPILARPVGQVERAWRWCRRNPKLAALMATVALVLVGWAASMTWAAVTLKVERDQTAHERDQKEEARRQAASNEQRALAEEAEAKKQEALTKGKLNTDLVAYSNGVKEILGKVNAQAMRQEVAPEVKALRGEILTSFRTGILAMASDLEQTRSLNFGSVRNYEIMGDLLKYLGQGEEALKHYRLAYEAAERFAQDQPDNDLARANLGITLLHLGEMYESRYGDYREARVWYEKGRRIRQDVADHPRSGTISERDTRINLSHYEIFLARAALGLGDPAEARGHAGKALELRTAWWRETPDLPEASSYLAEAYLVDALVARSLGEAEPADAGLSRAQEIQEGLVKANPKDSSYKADLAVILAHRGQACRAAGSMKQAGECYQRALGMIALALEGSRGNAEYYLQMGLLLEAQGEIAEAGGDAEGARKRYEEARDIFRGLIPLDKDNLMLLSSALRVSARNGNYPGALSLTEGAVLSKRPESIPLLLNAARCSAIGYRIAPHLLTRAAYLVKTLQFLRRVKDLGYRDAVAWKTDPDLRALEGQPGFEALLAEMGKP